jgi:hypothetical protein
MTFKIGDQVMLRTKDIRTLRPRGKLNRRQDSQEGPFAIIDAWGIQIKPPSVIQKYPFHVSLLKPFYSRDGQLAPPGLISIDGEDDWEIDAILAKRVRHGRAQYRYSHLPRKPCKTPPIKRLQGRGPRKHAERNRQPF